MKIHKLKIKNVEFVPEQLENGVLYVSNEYNIAIHLCACGCGCQTVTPLTADGWVKSGTDETVTLRPSIGNYKFECKSHYYITDNKIQWL